jgi:hypothetical protein
MTHFPGAGIGRKQMLRVQIGRSDVIIKLAADGMALRTF